ncbi:hypothetical protein OT109_12240 [Phycisphaeraceae bacterium D3-23]
MGVSASAWAGEPYVPDDDDTVLYELPQAWRQQRDAVTRAREAWAADPGDVEKACAVAGADLRLGQATGDPRFYGYARAALGPWWDESDAPPQVLAIRAKLKETDHDYAGAIADLTELLQQRPRETQAWIELTNLHRVRGDYVAALASVEQLQAFATPVPVALAHIPLLAVTGELDAADAQLAAVRPVVESDWQSALSWLLIMQAQLARARGEEMQAETFYRQAMARDDASGYLRRSYADLLLMQGRDDAALALCEDHTGDTGLLLRAAIAAKHTGDTERAAQWRDELQRRFEEIRLRGGEPHGRFEARSTLEVLEQPDAALELALANWEKQREQLDARHVLAAALAARNPDAAQPVLTFLQTHGTQDAELQALIDSLESLP